ncbi:gamma-glutamyl-gamma-aminobutyrate hydrolase family protein [Treponema pedis]|uniref:gamma-glutamyl-gamma-aminobutyrate hydrolase n=1 Tax=Treponema pedis str. T A4 TaxID=1291379 RepID=S6A055_9SPIR|nr:gamma-glutamyl-gamma-aminobutyrate hydrolase family protein [Treponema pedis]AGT44038.1 glutamine amidotransferase class I [Treponema pedis str. T A4]
MKKPFIGITGSCLYEKTQDLFIGYERMYTNTDYVNAVIAAGGVPVILPIIENKEDIKIQAENMDGIIIMGGYDVSPVFFNEEPLSCLGEVLPKRDIYEIELIKTAKEIQKPIFGICRGLQILNVAFGGSLYQDISSVKREIQIQHNQKARPDIRTHSIQTKEKSLMRKLFGKTDTVNSYHHMAIKDVAKDFIATAWAPDGIIEAMEYSGNGYIIGVQFHPEMLARTHKPSLDLFKEFIKKCG